jgi:hypothetical protein
MCQQLIRSLLGASEIAFHAVAGCEEVEIVAVIHMSYMLPVVPLSRRYARSASAPAAVVRAAAE